MIGEIAKNNMLGKKNEVLKYMTTKEMRKAQEKPSSPRQPRRVKETT